MLIVLWKLLELVLVVREASIYAEIPAGRQTDIYITRYLSDPGRRMGAENVSTLQDSH